MDKPILFSAPMVRALLDGRKTQTRRILKPQPRFNFGGAIFDGGGQMDYIEPHWETKPAFKYAIGDRLWVREAHYVWDAGLKDGSGKIIDYRATEPNAPTTWTPSIHMPRWASRLTLTVTDVRVERLQDISEDDAVAEGWPPEHERAKTGLAEIKDAYPIGWYAWLWESINGPGSWSANPWVAAYSFTVQRGNIDQAKEGK